MIFVFALLILTFILLSGYSDSSSAITGCVSARSLAPEGAVRLAAVCIFFGSIIFTAINPSVARTYFGIADFGDDRSAALTSLCAALCAAILWSLISHKFGFPVSESHALLSGMTGAALASRMSAHAISVAEWRSVLLGLFASTAPSFALGFIFNGALRRFLSRINRRSAIGHFRRSQRLSTAWNAALYGAQDCQKFIGVFMLGLSLATPEADIGSVGSVPFGALILCTSVLTLGTLIGTSNTVKKLGRDMTELDAPAYSAAGAAATCAMTLCTLVGLPADILHSRACAILGAGMCDKKRVNLRIAAQILGVWLLTFPACCIMGFILSFAASNGIFL